MKFLQGVFAALALFMASSASAEPVTEERLIELGQQGGVWADEKNFDRRVVITMSLTYVISGADLRKAVRMTIAGEVDRYTDDAMREIPFIVDDQIHYGLGRWSLDNNRVVEVNVSEPSCDDLCIRDDSEYETLRLVHVANNDLSQTGATPVDTYKELTKFRDALFENLKAFEK